MTAAARSGRTVDRRRGPPCAELLGELFLKPLDQRRGVLQFAFVGKLKIFLHRPKKQIGRMSLGRFEQFV